MKKAFTLIELLMAISIIALLIAIILPVLGSSRETARQVICASNQKQTIIAIACYAEDFDRKIPPYADPVDGDERQLLPWFSDIAFDEFLEQRNLAPLYTKAYLSSPEVLYCPSQIHDKFNSSENYDGPWGTVAGINGATGLIRIGFMYNPYVDNSFNRRYINYDKFPDDLFVTSDLNYGLDRSPHRNGGWNNSMKDGSVDFNVNPEAKEFLPANGNIGRSWVKYNIFLDIFNHND